MRQRRYKLGSNINSIIFRPKCWACERGQWACATRLLCKFTVRMQIREFPKFVSGRTALRMVASSSCWPQALREDCFGVCLEGYLSVGHTDWDCSSPPPQLCPEERKDRFVATLSRARAMHQSNASLWSIMHERRRWSRDEHTLACMHHETPLCVWGLIDAGDRMLVELCREWVFVIFWHSTIVIWHAVKVSITEQINLYTSYS